MPLKTSFLEAFCAFDVLGADNHLSARTINKSSRSSYSRNDNKHVCDYFSKRILRLSIYRLQIFLVKNQYLRSLQRYGDKPSPGYLKICSQACACDPYDLYGDQA